MAKMLVGSIDLNKIDKSRIVTTDKNGNAFSNGAKYYSIVLWINEQQDQYGNIASIQESISKEERESGIKANYVGNMKELTQVSSQQVQPQSTTTIVSDEDPDDLPF